jgi:hypothetical protein
MAAITGLKDSPNEDKVYSVFGGITGYFGMVPFCTKAQIILAFQGPLITRAVTAMGHLSEFGFIKRILTKISVLTNAYTVG